MSRFGQDPEIILGRIRIREHVSRIRNSRTELSPVVGSIRAGRDTEPPARYRTPPGRTHPPERVPEHQKRKRIVKLNDQYEKSYSIVRMDLIGEIISLE